MTRDSGALPISLNPSDYGYREGMGIFSKRDGLAKTAKFKSPHFISIAEKMLWQGEQIKAWGFYSQGDDPDGFAFKALAVEKNTTDFAFGGSPHRFIAATNWRLIMGYLASGILLSFPYQIADPQLEKDRSGLLLRFRDVSYAEDDNRSINTFVINQELWNAILASKGESQPSKIEETHIELVREAFGKGATTTWQVFVAEQASQITGSNSYVVAVCSRCGNETPYANEFPEATFETCSLCLRVNTASLI